MTLIEAYQNVEKHNRKKVETEIAKLIGEEEFWFSYMLEDTILAISYSDVIENDILKQLFYQCYNKSFEKITEDEYEDEYLGEDLADFIIQRITGFIKIKDIILTDENINFIIFGSK